MGTRNQERGQKAIDEMPEGCKGKVELVIVDVANEESVKAAAAALKIRLAGEKLYALVNNAGVALNGIPKDVVVGTNCYGPKWMTDNFIELVQTRIVNVGSGLGVTFVETQPEEERSSIWDNSDLTWEQLEAKLTTLRETLDDY